ncbi:MAG: HisA/HisF-related TIM barrel protein [Candidatus Bathyarchaeota archaeon]|nr:HisA/HisF-related TIM barrel protein [Candidatus Termiticorpusculum sp.]
MKLVPVLDVLNGIVVHAVKGNRKEYQPLKSVLTSSVNPVDVALVFRLQGFSELYLADLDAILGREPDFDLYRSLVQLGFRCMVDAGVSDICVVKKLLDCGVSKVVIGTETLRSVNFVKDVVKHIGAERVVVSLDIKDGQVLTGLGFDGSRDLFELIRVFCVVGVSEFILLDLTRVGSDVGVNIDLLRKVLTLIDSSVYVGGGVCGVEDLLGLKKLGVLGVLFASALHSGKIRVKDLVDVDLF